MGKIREAKRSIMLKNWKEEVEAQVSSGLSVSEWCHANNIAPKNYYYHLRKVREFFLEFSEQPEERQEIVSVTEISKTDPQIETLPATNVVIRKDGMEVEIPENISPQMLKLLLEGLKSC